MSGVKFVYPSEVFAAIAEAKKRDPKDKNGDGAFRPGLSNIRIGKNGTRYMPWDILKKDPRTGRWDYVELNVKFTNLNTSANMYPPGHAKKKYEGARIQFTSKNAYYFRKVTGADGVVREVEEHYGKAKVAIYKAFVRILTKLLKEKKVNNGNTKIASSVQTERIVNEALQEKAKLEEGGEIIRVEIPFNKTGEGAQAAILSTEPPRCDIYDITRPKKDHKKEDLPFEKNTFLDDDEKTPIPVNYGNIHRYITYGSSCSGIDCMDSACFSGLGISLPSKTTLLTVKRSKGRKPEANSVFSMSEFDDMSNAAVIEENPEAGDNLPTGDNVDSLPTTEGDMGDLLGDVKADDFDPQEEEIDEEDLGDD